MTMQAAKRSGGRPSKEQSGQIEEQILDNAAHLFLLHGYGATSIEEVASSCGISKRTFYHRFDNKKELFSAVVHRLITRVRPRNVDALFMGTKLEEVLLHIAEAALKAGLMPETLALHRIILAEASRFPELALVMEQEGTKAMALAHIAELLQKEIALGHIAITDTAFAAEQFLQMVLSVPQRRAMGLGVPMTLAELQEWAVKTVDLFLRGCHAV